MKMKNSKLLQFPVIPELVEVHKENLKRIKDFVELSSLQELFLIDSLCDLFEELDENKESNLLEIIIRDEVINDIRMHRMKSLINYLNRNNLRINYLCGLNSFEAYEYTISMKIVHDKQNLQIFELVGATPYMKSVLGDGEAFRQGIIDKLNLLQV